jgi:transcriptional regulator with XRE-family HTH domain
MVAGHSQEEFARLIAKHRTEISLLERGLRIPRLDTVIQIAAGLEIEPEDLFAGIRWHPGIEAVGGKDRVDPREFSNDVRRRFSANFHGLRVRSRRSGAALAGLAGLEPATVLSCEYGITMPQISTVIALCGALGVSPDDLVAGIRWSAVGSVIAPGTFRTVGEKALKGEIATLRAAVPRGRRGRGS